MTIEHATDTGIQFFSATQTQLRFGDAASTGAGSIIYEHATDKLRLSTDSLITFEDGGVERMRIDSSGNVGIGTTAPMVALNVHDSTNARIALTNSSTGQTFPDGFELLATGLDAYVQNRSNGDMIFTTNNTERMRIDSSGNLLVGTTTTPTLAGLAVGSTTTGKNISVFSSSNGTNGVITVHNSAGTQEGQLYAGTGDVNLFGTSVVKVVAATGGVQLTSGATSWAAISDERLKDVIEPITNAAQKVSTLRAVIGRYKTDTEETRRSFLIAQDVQAVLPEAVDATNENELGIRYTETIPLLVAAIQEQQATIQTLTARVAALEAN